MAFVALNKDGERICSLDHDDLRTEYQRGDFSCPLCSGEMIYKHGQIMRPHFAHRTDCTSDYEHKPESPEHLKGKEAVRAQLMRDYPEALIDFEVPFPTVKRIADVCLTMKTGWQEVHEVQFSGITTGTLEERTRDYESAGAQVFWYLGKAANTAVNVKWVEDRIGVCGILDIVE